MWIIFIETIDEEISNTMIERKDQSLENEKVWKFEIFSHHLYCRNLICSENVFQLRLSITNGIECI